MKRDLPKYTYRKGAKGYVYFVRGSICQRIAAPPGSNDFFAEYNRLLNGDVSAAPTRTIKKLIAHYMRSQEWQEKAKKTKRNYRLSFRYFEEKIGNVDPASIRRHNVIQMRDALADKPTTANMRITALSILMEHAIEIGWLETNHAKGTKRLKTHKTRQPWPQDMVDAFRDTADGTTLLIFELLIGTGQRIGDVLKMQWGHIEEGGILVRQGKTGREVWIPFTERLRAELDRTPRRGLYIASQANGRPISYNTAWRWVKDVRDEIGAQAWDIHSLRHYAASELAALGLDDDHIMALTGHTSSGMVRLYAGKAAQRARAKKAQAERNGNEP